MQFPVWLWIWIGVIAVMKTGNIVWGFLCTKKLISMHTVLNKVTGFLLFLFPLTLGLMEPVYRSVVLCFLATMSAIHEAYHLRRGKEVF